MASTFLNPISGFWMLSRVLGLLLIAALATATPTSAE